MSIASNIATMKLSAVSYRQSARKPFPLRKLLTAGG